MKKTFIICNLRGYDDKLQVRIKHNAIEQFKSEDFFLMLIDELNQLLHLNKNHHRLRRIFTC